MKIKKGDTVKIIIGKDSGKSGKVMDVNIKTDKVLLDGLNLYKKHVRPKRQGQKGEIVNVPRFMSVSNVALVCSSCKKQTRIGYREAGGPAAAKAMAGRHKKTRICKKCKASI